MKKKFFVSFLAVMLVMVTLCQTAFADYMDDVKNSQNAVVMVSVDNEDCEELKNLKDLKVRISCEKAGLDVTVPVEEVMMDGETMGLWLGYPSEKISDAIMNKLAELQGKIDLDDFIGDDETDLPDMEDTGDVIGDIESLLTDVELTVEGLPAGHYVVESSAAIITHEICKEAFDLIMEAAKAEFGEVSSFSELFDKLMEQLGLDLDELLDTSSWTDEDWKNLEEMGITAEAIESIKTLIANLDPLMEYMISEEFSGLLIADAYLTCQCPELFYYSIEHRYYERVGGKLKLVASVKEGDESNYYTLTGLEGDIISAKNFKTPVYQGRTYKYLGSYDDSALYDYKWENYKLDSFELGDEDYYGLILRYVYDKDGSGAGAGSTGSGSTGGESAPATGDETPLGVYVLVLVAAACWAGRVVVKLKRS